MQKAWVAGVCLFSAVSAPSSLAVDLACEADITLVGFNLSSRFTVYNGQHRIRQ